MNGLRDAIYIYFKFTFILFPLISLLNNVRIIDF